MKKVLFICMIVCVVLLLSNALADDDRIVISNVVATTNIPVDSIPVYGGSITYPVFTVQDSSKPAYFWPGNTRWKKFVDGDWEQISVSETFTSGKWRLEASIFIDSDSLKYALIDGEPTGDGTTHKLDKEGLIVKINGENWIIDYIGVGNVQSSCIVHSKEYTISTPIDFYFNDSAYFDIPESYVNKAISSIAVYSGAEGGTTPYHFSKVSGPEWIVVSNSGVISGTPTEVSDNTNLVVRAEDSSNPKSSAEITISVGKTYCNPNERAKISTIIATTNLDLSSIAVYGKTPSIPTFTVTTGKPSYFWRGNTKWQKFDGDTWSDYEGETFEEGTYRLKAMSFIDDDSRTYALEDGEETGDGHSHMFDKDNLVVTINGKIWEHENPGNGDSSCSLVAYSPSYVVKASNMGDIDKDGRITVADIRMLIQGYVHPEDLTEEQFAAGDMDEDGRITVADIRKLIQEYVKP